MNANELRVDNWITDVYAPEGKMFQIKEIHKIRCIYGNALLVSKYENLKPIPLSPEILEKCGFERVDHIHGYSFLSIIRKRKKYGCHVPAILIYENKTEINGYGVNHVTSLHQLQNLYFSLCGEELTITSK